MRNPLIALAALTAALSLTACGSELDGLLVRNGHAESALAVAIDETTGGRRPVDVACQERSESEYVCSAYMATKRSAVAMSSRYVMRRTNDGWRARSEPGAAAGFPVGSFDVGTVE